MTVSFIEFTSVMVFPDRAVPGASKIICVDHIASVSPGAQNTSSISLVNGETFSVIETYSAIKQRLGAS